MDIATRKNGDTLYIRISGAIDESSTEKLRSDLNKIALSKPPKVIMDLSLVPTIGSSGIGKILLFYKSLESIKSKFEIKGLQENLYKLFKAVKLDKLFPISMS